jgi:PEP-CTERM motif
MQRWVLFGLILVLWAAPEIALAAEVLPGAVVSGAAPISPIVLSETGPTVSCPTCGSIEVFPSVILGFTPQRGALIIGEGNLPLLTDSSTWSDVVLFTAGPELEGKTAQLFSDSPSGDPWPTTLEALVRNFAATSFFPLSEENPPTVYMPGGGVAYQIFSDAPGDHEGVPEPSTLLLLGSGLAGLAWAAWRRR